MNDGSARTHHEDTDPQGYANHDHDAQAAASRDADDHYDAQATAHVEGADD